MTSLRTLGRFTLLEQLGEGYLGPVYKARDPERERFVAIRILSDGIRWDADIRDRFRRECDLAASLQHPNIATLLEIGQEAQSTFIVTEFLEGAELRSLIGGERNTSIEEKLSIMSRVAEGLCYAHGNGALHCDLKPSNIHVTPAGDTKIRDFGIAQLLMRHLAHPGVRWGAAIYLSPEQIQRRDCDARSDIFSSGILFYELLTGAHPFHDANSNKAVDNILFETSLPTYEEYPHVPPGLWAILTRCMAKDPSDRFQTMTEVAGALRLLREEIAEDCQFMHSELLSALPRLRLAAQMPGAAPGLLEFLQEIGQLVNGRIRRDYLTLDRLMTELLEQYSSIPAVIEMCETSEGTLEVDPPENTPDASPDSAVMIQESAASPEELEPELPEADAGGALDPEAQPESDAPGTPSAVPEFDCAPQPETCAPRSIDFRAEPYRRRRISLRALRRTAALLAILLMAVSGYLHFDNIEKSVRTLWDTYAPAFPVRAQASRPASLRTKSSSVDRFTEIAVIQILTNEARVLAGQHRYEESRVFIHRILEKQPDYEPARSMLRQLQSEPPRRKI